MAYVLMLLADPGTERERVHRVFETAADIQPFAGQTNRYRLTMGGLEAELQIGTKDPVGSVHLEFDAANVDQMEAVALRALELADQLDMRVEDVVWGDEVTRSNMERLRAHWQQLEKPGKSAVSGAPKPWWRFW
jgi:hypothetical protein